MTDDRTLPAGSEDELQDVRASYDGDGEAYARLVTRHQDSIAAYMHRFTRDAAEREELTHETFVEAYFSLRTFRGKSPFTHWLKKIATRVGYRYWKARWKRRQIEPLTPVEMQMLGKPDQAKISEAAELVYVLLSRLRPRDRLILTLLYLEERSIAEIAELCGSAQTMVKVQAYRARNRLRKLMEKIR